MPSLRGRLHASGEEQSNQRQGRQALQGPHLQDLFGCVAKSFGIVISSHVPRSVKNGDDPRRFELVRYSGDGSHSDNIPVAGGDRVFHETADKGHHFLTQ